MRDIVGIHWDQRGSSSDIISQNSAVLLRALKELKRSASPLDVRPSDPMPAALSSRVKRSYTKKVTAESETTTSIITDKFYSIEFVAGFMGCSTKTLYRKIAGRQLAACRWGRQFRIRGEDLLAHLNVKVTQINSHHQARRS